ncbi:MAG: hypothetical protein GX309_11030, partial [Clostridiales bacterium]|nr:hypothetical protein [Clostridiales bacterium]
MDNREMLIEEIKKIIGTGDINNSRLLLNEYKKNFGSSDEIESMYAITYLYEKKYTEALECISNGL